MRDLPKIVAPNRVFPETRLLLDSNARTELNTTSDPWPYEELKGRCRDAFGLLAFTPERIDKAFLDGCPDLEIIGSSSISVAEQPSGRLSCCAARCQTMSSAQTIRRIFRPSPASHQRTV
ncbi:hypothetical protein [Methylocapsa aurea]|uniref:hypothetical protein n=1 Tax=Methylocapsa aurea TaxID=663610 RepID=UPI0012EC6105|nr:hypothetical protein [Methylocapsa aurea]